MSAQYIGFDWCAIEGLARCAFAESIRSDLENNVRWYWSRAADYSDDISNQEFFSALKVLGALSKSERTRLQLEPIEDELVTVQWFLEVMSQSQPDRIISRKRFLYFRIWKCIGRAGIKLTRGKGTPSNRLSHAQKIFREICQQAGLKFPSDQALADALKRALDDAATTGAK